ncbi:MAG: glycosyltransferase family 39 protein [Candidatus Krumholzibacteriaceae bacterium]
MAELPFFTSEEGRGRFLALLFFLSVSVITVWGTWQGTLPASDEAVIAETGREIVTTGAAVTMHFDGEPVHDTPPLGPWLIAIFCRLFGTNEFAARFAFLAMSVLTLFILYHAGRLASQDWCLPGTARESTTETGPEADAGTNAQADRRTHWGTLATATGFLSAAVLGSTPLYAKLAPHITLGLPFAFCAAVALLGWLYLPSGRIGLILWEAAVAGCVLSAGAGGFFVIAGAFLASLADGKRRVLLRSGGFYLATLVGVAVGGLWLLPETMRSGQGFFENALWAPLARVVRPSAAAPSLVLDAFKNVWFRTLPWSVLATGAFIKVVSLTGRRRREALVEGVDGALFIFAAVVFLPLSLGGAAHLSPFLPVLPFVSIISAREIARWLQRPGADLARRVWTLNHVMTALFCLFMLLVVATPIVVRRIVNDPIKDVARMAARLTPETERIGNFAQPYRQQCARMLFYGGRSLEKPRGSVAEVAAALAENPRMIFLSSARDLASLRAAEDFPFEIKVLYGSGDLVLFGARELRPPHAP